MQRKKVPKIPSVPLIYFFFIWCKCFDCTAKKRTDKYQNNCNNFYFHRFSPFVFQGLYTYCIIDVTKVNLAYCTNFKNTICYFFSKKVQYLM